MYNVGMNFDNLRNLYYCSICAKCGADLVDKDVVAESMSEYYEDGTAKVGILFSVKCEIDMSNPVEAAGEEMRAMRKILEGG